MVLSKELAHKDSNLEMTESESVALPFGDGPMCFMSQEKQRTMDKEAVSVEKKEEMNEPEYEHPVQVRIVWAV